MSPNDPIATYRKEGDRYIVEVTGKRLVIAHGSFKFVTVDDKNEFNLPRIEGVIDGSEIHQKPGYYLYAGKIEIRGNIMSVKLSYINSDDNRLDPTVWNGKYILEEKISSVR
ncbi:MAG: hypothetical protein LBE33_09730 [Zoogloeaceae bacterium]|jgi:hypothetical protein|nr:hypothetical protein [Zoogloeaceae bacterium]